MAEPWSAPRRSVSRNQAPVDEALPDHYSNPYSRNSYRQTQENADFDERPYIVQQSYRAPHKSPVPPASQSQTTHLDDSTAFSGRRSNEGDAPIGGPVGQETNHPPDYGAPREESRDNGVGEEDIAALLARDDDAFAQISNHVMHRRSVLRETPDAIVWDGLAEGERAAFAAAYRHRASRLSTFPEAGEKPIVSLVRSVRDSFGSILSNVPPPSARRAGGGPSGRTESAALPPERTSVGPAADARRDGGRRGRDNEGFADQGGPPHADAEDGTAFPINTPPGPAPRYMGGDGSAERSVSPRQNRRMSRGSVINRQPAHQYTEGSSPYFREEQDHFEERMDGIRPLPPRREESLHSHATRTQGSDGYYHGRDGASEASFGHRGSYQRNQGRSVSSKEGISSPSNRSVRSEPAVNSNAGYNHHENESRRFSNARRGSRFESGGDRSKATKSGQFSFESRSRSDANQEGGTSPSSRSHRSVRSHRSSSSSTHRHNNEQHWQRDDRFERENDNYDQHDEYGARNEGLRRRVSPRSAANDDPSSAHSYRPSPGTSRSRDMSTSSRNYDGFPSVDGSERQQSRGGPPWDNVNYTPRSSQSAPYKQSAVNAENLPDFNQEDVTNRSLGPNAVLDAAPNYDHESFSVPRASGANPSYASVASAPASTSAKRTRLKSALKTAGNLMRAESALDENTEVPEDREPMQEPDDEQNVVVEGLHRLDIDATQRELAIREAKAVQAQSRMRQHLMEELGRTREILQRTTDQSTRASYELHMKGLQVELDKWNRSLKVSRSSSFGTNKNGLFGPNEEDEDVEERRGDDDEGERVINMDEGVEDVEEGVEDVEERSQLQEVTSISPSTTIATDPNKEMRKSRQVPSNIEMTAIRPKATPSVSFYPKATPSARSGMVNVVAPAALPAGYRFEARNGHKTFVATVPPGGVKKGQVFSTPFRENDDFDDTKSIARSTCDLRSVQHSVAMIPPNGRWRDELFDCLNDGCFHPMLCNSCICPQVALTQIMARMRITSQGDRNNGRKSRLSIIGIWSFTAAILLLNGMFVYIMIRRPQLSLLIICSIPTLLLDLSILVYFFSITVKIRRTIREEFSIPETRCRGCEDVAVSLCCTSCALSQMGRHTADYSTFRGTCCTITGLPDHVEPYGEREKEQEAGVVEQKDEAPFKDEYDEEFAYHEF